MSELKEYLKVFIKEKENMYKIKIHNKLYGGSANKRVSGGSNKKRKRDQIEGREGSSAQQNDKKRRRVTDQESDDSEYSI